MFCRSFFYWGLCRDWMFWSLWPRGCDLETQDQPGQVWYTGGHLWPLSSQKLTCWRGTLYKSTQDFSGLELWYCREVNKDHNATQAHFCWRTATVAFLRLKIKWFWMLKYKHAVTEYFGCLHCCPDKKRHLKEIALILGKLLKMVVKSDVKAVLIFLWQRVGNVMSC